LIEDGEITIGRLRPIGWVVTAVDEDCIYTMLVRRRGESMLQLPVRLDQAIDKAFTLDIFTDEINPKFFAGKCPLRRFVLTIPHLSTRPPADSSRRLRNLALALFRTCAK
jgi:hypothetical protein